MHALSDMKAVVTSTASSTGAQVANNALSALFCEAKLPEDALEAITKMKAASPGFDDSFLHSLKRDLVGGFLGRNFSGQVFNESKSAQHLLKHQSESSPRLARLTNQNLIEAITALILFQGEIASYFNQRSTEVMADTPYSYVLLSLHHVVSQLIQQLSDKNDLSDKQLDDYQQQITLIYAAFSKYVSGATQQASSGDRRGAIQQFLKEKGDEAKICLERCKTSRTLQSSMHNLRANLGDFSVQLERVLFAIIIEPGIGADEQLQKGEILEHANKQLFLERLLTIPDKNSLLFLEEKQSTGYRTTFSDRATGTLYVNPFFERVNYLLENYSAAKKANKAPTKEQIFFDVLLYIFNARRSSCTSSDVQKKLAAFASYYNDEKSSIGEFSMLQGSGKATMLLKAGSNVGNFLQGILALFQQSNELVRFLNTLNDFMSNVGKVGLFNKKDLHSVLQGVINTAQTTFVKNFDMVMECISVKAKGRWLDLLKKWFDKIKEDGESLKMSMTNFSKEFVNIADKKAMKAEFEMTKNELMKAAVGVATACGLGQAEVNNLSALIGGKNLDQFLVAPLPRVSFSALLECNQQQIGFLIGHSHAITKLYETTAADFKEANAQLKVARDVAEESKKSAKVALEQSEKLQKKIGDAKAAEQEKDELVVSLVKTLSNDLKAQQKNNEKVIQKAEELIGEFERSFGADSKADAKGDKNNQVGSETTLEKARLLLSELNGSKIATDTLIGTVRTFGEKYAIYADIVKNALAELQNIASDMNAKIKELETRANTMQKMVTKLQNNMKTMAENHQKQLEEMAAEHQKQLAIMKAEMEKSKQEAEAKIEQTKKPAGLSPAQLLSHSSPVMTSATAGNDQHKDKTFHQLNMLIQKVTVATEIRKSGPN
jgi:hypothetical protein